MNQTVFPASRYNQAVRTSCGWLVTANPIFPYSDFFNLLPEDMVPVLDANKIATGTGQSLLSLAVSLHQLATTGSLEITACSGDQIEYADRIVTIYNQLDGDDFSSARRIGTETEFATRGAIKYLDTVKTAIGRGLIPPVCVADYIEKRSAHFIN